MPESLPAFGLEPQYREYVWGGARLRPGKITAEAWIVHEGNRILSGPLTGKTLAEAAEESGPALLGHRSVRRIGNRFPLLIKLLDCAQWLSLQVHPNDEQAVVLEGAGQFGKTEAWHILNADPDAEILCGFRSGVTKEMIDQSIRDGSILNYTQKISMHTGDTIFIPAGTVHALGPGLLAYEVQQTSDITYRVFDWNRPASAGRKIHIEQSLAVLDSTASGHPIQEPPFEDGNQRNLVQCPYFSLNMLSLESKSIQLNTAFSTFHTLTPIEGTVKITGTGWEMEKRIYETSVIPASAGKYTLSPMGKVRILKSSIEEL
ncbi:MAG: class I mannose-6-phosphate isomerase [Anaerolineaceae bacterium]|nr:class I mannose-6-phosphate isomerase [Anaerolineaceae bacterium]